MASSPPPHGMNEADYDTIEAAVTETVRGRWFLNEFARRNRLAETHQLLEAMARLEAAVFSNQTALPSADPSVRLLIQRIKEVAGQLGSLAADMRGAGVDKRFVEAIDSQARAVAGMMRGNTSERLEPPTTQRAAAPPPIAPRRPDPSPASGGPFVGAGRPPINGTDPAGHHDNERAADPTIGDPRLAALSRFDRLSPAEKLALFV